MKKKLLEKLEWEKKFKLEIIKIRKEYPSINPPNWDFNKIVSNPHKNQKIWDNPNDELFGSIEKKIDSEISQRNYHSKYVVCW